MAELAAALPEDDIAAIRRSVKAICTRFPGEYWREKDRERAYPTEFVTALTEDGFLSVLIPEAYGGSGLGLRAAVAILEEVHANGCNAAACHAQMYTMGTVLQPRQRRAEGRPSCPQIAEWRPAACRHSG